MTRVRVASFAISLDGYGAGPNQDIDNPLGAGGTDLHQWAFPARTFQKIVFGIDGGATGIDDDYSCVEHVASEKATHVVLRRRKQSDA